MLDEKHQRFVDRFAAAWSAASADRLAELLHDEVRLIQPLLPPIVGKEKARRSFERFLQAIPDLRFELLGAAASDRLFIEFTFAGTLGARPVKWTLVDRILLEGELVRERISYFDPLPLIPAALLRPVMLWRLMRS